MSTPADHQPHQQPDQRHGPVEGQPRTLARDLAEYVSLDAEVGFIRDHHDVLAVLRDSLAGMVDAVCTYAAAAVELLGVDLPTVPEQIPVVHFADALGLVGADPGEPDLAPEHERALGRWALAQHGSDLLAVEGYPRWPTGVSRRSRTRPTWTPSGTVFRRTAGSPSGSSGGRPGWCARRTSGRPHCSPETCTGWPRDPPLSGRAPDTIERGV
ncbi:hypothetical protein BH20ACT6_BH20ACT6_11140 [soil metagenome]